MTGLAESTYGVIAGLAMLNLVLCVIVVFRARFCSPFVVLLVGVISLLNLGLLLSGLQRLAQHADLTIGLIPIVLGQALGTIALGWIAFDTHDIHPLRRWRR